MAIDFRYWLKNMHFLLTTLKVVYVLRTPCLRLLRMRRWNRLGDIAKG